MSSHAGWACATLSGLTAVVYLGITQIKEPHLKHLNLSGNQHDSLDLLVHYLLVASSSQVG